MSHMEYNECQFLIPGFVQELRANNPRSSGKFEAIRAATAQNGRIDTGLSTVSIAMKRQSAAENDDLISFPDAASHANDASWYRPAVPVNNAVEFPALTLADVLKNSANPAKASSRNAQPVKPANTATLLGNSASYARIHVNDSQTEFATPPSPAIPAWNTVARAPASHVLFPNAAPAIAPLAAQIQNLSMSSNSPPHPVYQEHDPDDPNFDVNRYYVDMLKYYQCPHRGCKKNLNTVSAFFQHLRSPAHMKVRNPFHFSESSVLDDCAFDHPSLLYGHPKLFCAPEQIFDSVSPVDQLIFCVGTIFEPLLTTTKLDQVKCPQCLRPFLNTTALTQHIESQTVRCDARNLESAGILVEDLTQVATVIGVHEDETIKYGSVQSTFVDAATAAANAIRNNSRRTIDAQADFKDKHWDEKKTFGNW